jgi:hypothetical protein
VSASQRRIQHRHRPLVSLVTGGRSPTGEQRLPAYSSNVATAWANDVARFEVVHVHRIVGSQRRTRPRQICL